MFNEVKSLCWGQFQVPLSIFLTLIFYKLNNSVLDVRTTASWIAGLQFSAHNSACHLPGGQDLVFLLLFKINLCIHAYNL
jgi:hypothetical protein